MARKVTVAPRRLNEVALAALPVGKIIRDRELAGFMAQRNRDGIVYKVQRDYRAPDADKPVTFRKTFSAASLDDARVEALRLLAMMRRGINPNHPEDAPAPDWPKGIPSVEQMYEDWIADRLAAGKAQSTFDAARWRLDKYLADWKPLAATLIKRSTIRERHAKIARENGPRAANQTVGDFGAAWKHMAKTVDDDVELPASPAVAVTKAKERGRSTFIPQGELASWWAAVGELPRLRRCMHSLGILSGLRPGNLKNIRREWVVDLDGKEPRIVFPGDVMKNRDDFMLPLSPAMVTLVKEAVAAGDILKPGTPFLFPHDKTKDRGAGSHTEKAKTGVKYTGHALRHTYRTCVTRLGLGELGELLVAHRLPGVRGRYVHRSDLYRQLLDAQCQVTAALHAAPAVAMKAAA